MPCAGLVCAQSDNLAAAMTGDRYGIAEDGVGTIIIDPVKAFGTSKVALANFKVKLTVSDSAANINEVLYKIVDLEKGGTEKCIAHRESSNGNLYVYGTDWRNLPTRPIRSGIW